MAHFANVAFIIAVVLVIFWFLGKATEPAPRRRSPLDDPQARKVRFARYEKFLRERATRERDAPPKD